MVYRAWRLIPATGGQYLPAKGNPPCGAPLSQQDNMPKLLFHRNSFGRPSVQVRAYNTAGRCRYVVSGRPTRQWQQARGSDDTKRDRPGSNPGTRCSRASVAAWVSGARGSYRRFNRSIWVGNARIFLISSQLDPPASTPVAATCAHAAPKPVPGGSLSRRHAQRPDLDEGNPGVLGLSCLPWAAKTP